MFSDSKELKIVLVLYSSYRLIRLLVFTASVSYVGAITWLKYNKLYFSSFYSINLYIVQQLLNKQV